MNHGIVLSRLCRRCGAVLQLYTGRASVFDGMKICPRCVRDEQKAPGYREASNAVEISWRVALELETYHIERKGLSEGDKAFLAQRRAERALEDEVITFVQQYNVPPEEKMKPEEKERIVASLVWQYGLPLMNDLNNISEPTLIHMVNLAPDFDCVSIYKLWSYRMPHSTRQKIGWKLTGAPMTWQFEVAVLATLPWRHSIKETLEEARLTAQSLSNEYHVSWGEEEKSD